MIGMDNQYIKNSINNSESDRKYKPCSVKHSVGVRQLKHTIVFLIPLLLLSRNICLPWSDSVSPNYIDLCRDNIQDHGEYHDNVSNPLLGCIKTTIDIIDKNHLRLYIPTYDKTIYLTRVV
jgi:hypothetical protein